MEIFFGSKRFEKSYVKEEDWVLVGPDSISLYRVPLHSMFQTPDMSFHLLY